MMVGTAYASFDEKVSIELKKDLEKVPHFDLICNGVSPDVSPKFSKTVTLLTEDDLITGYTSDITPSANDPPTIRML
ncbi:hypothetical protein SMI01S_11820 [Sphingobacterium mizutaii NBRC 14946 = DSM 11724]|uniref:Uncharacterized protein n=2 Tax=Sphingobacterium mizutaii TaxID=1010 RepID=A0AAJ5C0W2_9SPHI|nr:hypothetical protein [Sphingobacterium mizutaii]GEM67576.1 hypothetical protein SMI01S_11820 [Sphingobacterium mizutaii NBRC 14946 = DSM 11724]SDL14551.1 hypothetical protein SAMN05192578_1011516 [Sphingobacterium mizutaii]SNV52167.1 Uncharacterised protein [Sphingobacterium mizutaii]